MFFVSSNLMRLITIPYILTGSEKKKMVTSKPVIQLISSFEAIILDSPLPVKFYCNTTSKIGLLNAKNMGVAVEISLLSCLPAEI